ncbi:MAG TPA: EF-P beta-lysylation protein EpmB [Pirellulaceae bacterium]|nr:EF-P beta-lysylation protein EpmB [Pirellulaceae bacterium]
MPQTWQAAMRSAVRDVPQLLSLLSLGDEWLIAAQKAAAGFPLFAPREFIDRMEIGNPHDPLLRQVLPLGEELVAQEGFTADPVGDLAAQKAPGLLHKYHGRALLVTTGACAIHCRYCFRRSYPYSDGPRSLADWEPALEAIADDSTIEEILLSGGDPLTIVDSQLAALVQRLDAIDHIRRLRIHTRLPIVIPQRVNDELLGWLRGTRLTPIVVVHANHPQEIDEAVAQSLARLVDAGIPVLNQSVLLRGVNDHAAALIELSRRLVNLRVMPYYLHQLDRVEGAAHFEVPVCRGIDLIDQMRRELPGYAVPRYVQEIAGDEGKRVLA